MPEFDLFVIGGGSGGVACARRAASHGARVAIAEGSRVGGTCVIRGCVPKKLMHYGAHFAEWFKAARCYGWEIGDPRLVFERLCEARNTEISRLNGIYLQLLERSGVQLFESYARLERSGEDFRVTVGERAVTASRVLIAVGARPSLPELPGVELAVTSDRVLEDVYPLPERLAVIGAGYIGLELASILSAVGSRTTLILRGDLPLRGFEHDLRQHLAVEVEGHGVTIWNETVVERIERAAGGLQLDTSRGPLEVDMVLYATGRSPVPADPLHRPGGAGRRPQPERHGPGRRPLSRQPARPVRSRRLQRPCRHRTGRLRLRPHAGGDRRGPRARREPVQRQGLHGRLRHHPDRDLRPAPGGLGRPVRGQGAGTGP